MFFAIFVLAFAVRIIYLVFALGAHEGKLHETISGADCYFVISENILQGNGYSCKTEPPYTLNSIRPPVQPYFLVALYSVAGTYWFALLVQIAFSSMVPLIGMYVARYLTPNPNVIVGVGLLLALEPSGILFSMLFYGETLFTVAVLGSIACVCAYIKKGSLPLFATAGFLLGLATLTKPTTQYLPLVIVLLLAWHFRKTLRTFALHAAIFLLVFMATLSPWVYRNYQHFGVVGVSPQLGEQLYAVLVPSVLSFENGTTFAQEFERILANGGTDPSSASVENGTKYFKMAVPMLLAHPFGLVVISANTALNFFIHDGMIEVLKHLEIRPKERLGQPALFLLLTDPGRLFGYIGHVFFTPLVWILVGRIVWVAITVLAFFGLVRYLWRESTKIYATLFASIVLYFMLTTLVIGLAVTARYRIPINALIFIFALYELVGIVTVLYRRGVREAWKQCL